MNAVNGAATELSQEYFFGAKVAIQSAWRIIQFLCEAVNRQRIKVLFDDDLLRGVKDFLDPFVAFSLCARRA